MLLIFPPVAKPCEPPAGIAKLVGALKAHSISCNVLDMNLEGLLHLLEQPLSVRDTWTRRAANNIPKNIAALRNPRTCGSLDRYSRAVKDVNRILEVVGSDKGVTAGLADYQDRNLSPVRSADLIKAAEHPEQNVFYPYFKKRLRGVIEEIFFPQSRTECKENPEKRHVDKRKMQFIGFSLNYLSQALCTFSMIGFIKKEFPGLKVILGGGLVTSWTKGPGWRNLFDGLIDQFISGPGEIPLLGLLGIKDVMHSHYLPDYESLPLQHYLSPGFILPYSGSSGCYWNKCSFCPETAEDNPYRPVPIDRAMTDLNCLISKTRPVLVHLLDNGISPALMRSLADKPIGTPWYGFARINRDLADFDFCTALKRSGCVMLKLGLESGDQGVLDKMHKGINLETASQVLKNLQKAGIAAYVYLLFGTPSETLAEARKTLDFVVRHRDAITFLNLAIFNMPLCGSEWEQYEADQFYEGDLSLYAGFRHPHGWSRRQVRQFLDREFKRHKAVASILRNDPPVFTSNHAPFFHPR